MRSLPASEPTITSRQAERAMAAVRDELVPGPLFAATHFASKYLFTKSVWERSYRTGTSKFTSFSSFSGFVPEVCAEVHPELQLVPDRVELGQDEGPHPPSLQAHAAVAARERHRCAAARQCSSRSRSCRSGSALKMRDYMAAYEDGATGKTADKKVRQYRSHR